MYNLKNKSILITGGTGSFGKAFIKRLIEKKSGVKKIAIYSRDELKQHQLQVMFPPQKYPTLRFFLGDVRDKERLQFALKEINIVVHAAALKHVSFSEYNPFEFIKTNIIGSQNIVDASLSSNVEKVVLLSTDKAVAPANLYGATKLCAEKIFINSNNIKGKKKIDFSVVRYGNVFGSRGSVFHEFIKQKLNGKFMINDIRMTRFHITLDQSVSFVINAIINSQGGEIFIPKLPSFYIKDLAKALCKTTKMHEIGIIPGEKIHEELISNNEYFNIKEKKNYFIMTSNFGDMQHSKKEKSNNIVYSSDKNKIFLSIKQLAQIIENHKDLISF